MLVEYTRVVAECDGCGASEGPAPERPEWFDTFDQARDELSEQGWTGTDTNARRLLCPVCTGADECAAAGHAYSEWNPAAAVEVRDCERCGLVEFRPRPAADALAGEVLDDAPAGAVGGSGVAS